MDTVPGRGSLLVIAAEGTTNANASVTGGGVTQWRLAQSSLTGSPSQQMWLGLVEGTPSRNVTVHLGATATTATAHGSEWRGFVGVPSFVGAATQGTTSGPAAASTGLLPAQAGDLVLATLLVNNATQRIPNPTGGFVVLQQLRRNASTPMNVAYRVATGNETVGATWTFGQAQRWSSLIVAIHFTPTEPPEPPGTGPRLVQQMATSAWDVSSLQVRLPHVPTPGNLLVICHESGSSSNSTIRGGGVAQWTRCVGSAPDIVNSSVWAGIVGNSPTDTIDITLASSPNGAMAIVTEWSGMSPTLSYRAVLASEPLGSTLPRTASVLTQPGELVIAMLGYHQGGNTISPSSGGFTELGQLYEPSIAMSACYKVPTASGLVETGWTLQNSTRWAAPIVVFDSPPPPPTSSVQLVQQALTSGWNLSSLQVQLPSLPRPGNLLVICHESGSSSNSTIQGGGVAQWTRCVGSAPDIVNSSVWAGIVGNSPTSTINITLASSPNGAAAAVTEWSGLSPTLSYRAVLASEPLGSTLPHTANVPVAADELVIAMAGYHQGGNLLSAPSDGFVEIGQRYEQSLGMAACYLLPTTAATVGTGWTLLSSTRWAAPLVVFAAR